MATHSSILAWRTPWTEEPGRLQSTHWDDRGFLSGASGEEPACQCRRHKRRRFDPWVGKIPWKRNGYSFQYSCLENSMDRGDLAGYSPWGQKESDTTEPLTLSQC